MKRKFTRKQVTLMIIGILIILLLIFTAAYAFLGPVIGAGSKTDLDVTIKGVDLLELEAGDPINLTIGSHNLHDAAANVEGETFARATLIPNKTTLTATKYYNLGMNIANNTFVYSDGSTPEILLQLFDPEGNVITTAGDLSYVTINGVSGFDITTATGKITLASSREINATTEEGTVENWVIKVIILNLPDVDQTPNANASFEMDTAVNEEGEITEPILIHEKIEADAVLSNDLATISVDESIRYVGADVNNYVCFGSDEEICPEDNLYQMIGLYDVPNPSMKLMKVTSIDTGLTEEIDNINYLNTNFYNTLPANYKSMIQPTWLELGDASDLPNYDATVSVYNIEGCNRSETTKNIGWVNTSEYIFSQINSETWMNTEGIDTDYSHIENIIKPAIYLNSAVAFSGGNGTETNPYRLKQLSDDNIAINIESNVLKVNLPTTNYNLTKIFDTGLELPTEPEEPSDNVPPFIFGVSLFPNSAEMVCDDLPLGGDIYPLETNCYLNVYERCNQLNVYHISAADMEGNQIIFSMTPLSNDGLKNVVIDSTLGYLNVTLSDEKYGTNYIKDYKIVITDEIDDVTINLQIQYHH